MQPTWLDVLDAYAADVARVRDQLVLSLEDNQVEFEPIGARFDLELGALPPELVTYAQSVVADAMLLEEELGVAQRAIGRELGRARRRSIASIGVPTGSRFDSRA